MRHGLLRELRLIFHGLVQGVLQRLNIGLESRRDFLNGTVRRFARGLERLTRRSAFGSRRLVPRQRLGQLRLQALLAGGHLVQTRRLLVADTGALVERLGQPLDLGRVLKGQRRPELRGFRQLALERGDFVGFGRLAERPGFGQLRGQAGALGFVRGLLLRLLGHRLDERLLEAARFGDVPERGQHRVDAVRGARMGRRVQLHRVTGTGQRRQVDFERSAVPRRDLLEKHQQRVALVLREQGGDRRAEELFESLGAKRRDARLVDGHERAVSRQSDEDDRLRFQNGPEMRFGARCRIDTDSRFARRLAHGIPIGT